MLFSFWRGWMRCLIFSTAVCVCCTYRLDQTVWPCRIVIWSCMSAEWEMHCSAFPANYYYFFFQAGGALDCDQKYLLTLRFFFTPHVAR